MDAIALEPPIRRLFDLPGRGGAMAGIGFGPSDRPVDVVFVHANGFNALTYRHILSPLGDDLHVLAVDQRGHGRSTLPLEPEPRTNWDALRDDLLALLGLIDAQDVVLAGHSMGGTASLLAAAAAPERVKAVALFDPVIMPPSAPKPGPETEASPLVQGARRRRAVFPDRAAALAAYTGRGAFRTWPEAMLADYVADGFRDTAEGEVELSCPPAWEASNFASAGSDVWGAFAAVEAPVRILRAEEGSTCRIDERLAELTADGKILAETVAGTSHFLPMERPDLVREALRAAAG